MDLQISLFQQEEEEDLLIASNPCPKCSKENSLIITGRKNRRDPSKYGENLSLMRIQCICCKWKIMKDFKWTIQK